MFELPSKIAQATEAMVTIAIVGSGRPVSGKQLSEWLNVPPRFLEQTMQQLVHAGLLKSVRGPKGGYTLARSKQLITLKQLSDALCDSDIPDPATGRTDIGRSVVLPAYRKVEERLMEYLAEVSLADLCDMAKKEGALASLPVAEEEFA